jgi:hypothetical protein
MQFHGCRPNKQTKTGLLLSASDVLSSAPNMGISLAARPRTSHIDEQN